MVPQLQQEAIAAHVSEREYRLQIPNISIVWQKEEPPKGTEDPWGRKLDTDHNGHIIPRELGGQKEPFNFFAQNASLNTGGYRTMGSALRTKLDDLHNQCQDNVYLDLTVRLLHDDGPNIHGLPLRPDDVEVSGSFSDGTLVSGWFTNDSAARSPNRGTWWLTVGNRTYPGSGR